MEFNALGELKQIANLDKDVTVSITSKGLYWYASKYSLSSLAPNRSFFLSQGSPYTENGHLIPGSGAYVFRPLLPEPSPISLLRSM